jgi:hypothetical protein
MKPTNRYIIRPGTNYSPNSGIFLEMDKNTLKDFYQWFMLSLPYSIEELMQLIANTRGFESWNADDSPNSLDGLGAWFATKVEKRDFTPEETEAIKRNQTNPVEFTSWGLTDETNRWLFTLGCTTERSRSAIIRW